MSDAPNPAPAPVAAPAPSVAPAPAPAATPSEDRRVPYKRFQSVVSARDDLAAQLEAARAEIQTLSEKAATVDTLSGHAREWQQKYESATQRFGRYQAVSSSTGVTDPETIELFEFRYGKLPEDNRPAFGDWVKAQAENPAEADAILRPFLPGQQPATKPPTAGVMPRPPANAGAQPTQPNASQLKAGDVARMTDEQYRAWRKSAIEQQGGRWKL